MMQKKMETNRENKPTDEEPLPGIDLHPRHESWARFSATSTLVWFWIVVILMVLFVLGIRAFTR
jgi:cell division septal protein FtsQ